MNFYTVLNKAEVQENVGRNHSFVTGTNRSESYDPREDWAGGFKFAGTDVFALLQPDSHYVRVVTINDGIEYASFNSCLRGADTSYDWHKTPEFVLGERLELSVDNIKRLVADGADPHAGGENLLRWACIARRHDVLDYVLSLNPKLDAGQCGAVVMATKYNNMVALRKLISLGAKVRPHDFSDEAIYSAHRNWNFDALRLLIETAGVSQPISATQIIEAAEKKGRADIVELMQAYL